MTTHRYRRWGRVIGVSTVAALGLSACGGGAGGESGGDGSGSFSFTYAASNTLDSPWEALAEAYMEENPDVSITLNSQPNDSYGESLRTQLQGGNAADVMQTVPGTGQTRGVVALAEAGFLAPLDDAVGDFLPEGSHDQYVYEGQYYGAAPGLALNGLVTNQTVAEELGLETFPETFEDLVATCEDVASDGDNLLVLAGGTPQNSGVTALMAASTAVYAVDPEWNEKRAAGEVTFADSEEWHQALDDVMAMIDAECFQPGAEGAGFDVLTDSLVRGQAMAMFGPGGAAPELEQAHDGLEFVLNAFPPHEGQRPSLQVSANYLVSLNADAAENEAAKDFIDWLRDDDALEIYADVSDALPADLDDYDFAGSSYAPVEDLLLEGDYYAPFANDEWPNPAIYEALGSGVQGLLTGQKTPEQVLTDMDDAWGE
ncbi:extracellular solute-binding protein [Nesterenkonia sp. CL21]|uniref:extracellular solute-binding protein n=1 Tax=Nesterenkonia sp. CL21 TaxID=3064894 RepID=UPI00287A9580|nr:extracellular solute-binding protein [Nesterenkonia sp. CL21]MDS2173424.1 extracellular solute-binding protein [Nesterenkonia sp. CL21]